MQRIKSLRFLIFSISLLCSSWAQAFDLSSPEALNYVQKLIDINNKKITDIAAELNNSLKSQSELELSRLDADRERFSDHINSLIRLRKEFLLRQDFYDRLKLQIEKYYRGKSLEVLLVNRLEFMLKVELKSQDTHQGLWQFMHYLRTALLKIPERNENPLAFVEGYIDFSSISRPKTPNEFLKSRDYINTYSTQKANDVKRTDVGQKLEDSLNQLVNIDKQKEELKVKPAEENKNPISEKLSKENPQEVSAEEQPEIKDYVGAEEASEGTEAEALNKHKEERQAPINPKPESEPKELPEISVNDQEEFKVELKELPPKDNKYPDSDDSKTSKSEELTPSKEINKTKTPENNQSPTSPQKINNLEDFKKIFGN